MKLYKSIVTVSGFTFLSRITGFIRDALIAGILGVSGVTDAFFIAFKLPNFSGVFLRKEPLMLPLYLSFRGCSSPQDQQQHVFTGKKSLLSSSLASQDLFSWLRILCLWLFFCLLLDLKERLSGLTLLSPCLALPFLISSLFHWLLFLVESSTPWESLQLLQEHLSF